MNRSDVPKAGLALLAIAGAGFFMFRSLRDGRGGVEQAYFYDESQRQLFVAGRDLIPPIPGRDGPEEDGVRAVVVSITGDPGDKASRRIAYLEKYSPDLKRQMESARDAGSSPEMGRGAAQQHRWVRRESESAWHPLSSPEGEQIVGEWVGLGVNGKTPVVCVP